MTVIEASEPLQFISSDCKIAIGSLVVICFLGAVIYFSNKD